MPTAKRALICGISGQYGSYLAKLLLNQGYEVWGTSRDAEIQKFENLHRLKIFNQVRLSSLDPQDPTAILAAVRRIKPDEIFSLAGQTSVGLSFEQPVETIESIAVATLNLLEVVRLSGLDIRLYNAGSSEIFGDTGCGRANEDSAFRLTQANNRIRANLYAYRALIAAALLTSHFVAESRSQAAAAKAPAAPQNTAQENRGTPRPPRMNEVKE
jgi:GDP-D-mannose dehydratase